VAANVWCATTLAQIGPAARVSIPKDAVRVEGRGKS